MIGADTMNLAPPSSPSRSLLPSSDVPYPRTGKRGVPQQFARRLYDMLQAEERRVSLEDTATSYITWSSTGLAFKLVDVDAFTAHVLPKFFRTTKFSSFQRNLNLYGFSKVRRGPDTDMYAHPSFIRGKPELLFDLRKCPPASRSSRNSSTSTKKSLIGSSSNNKTAQTRRILSLSSSACYESDDAMSGTVVSHGETEVGSPTPIRTTHVVMGTSTATMMTTAGTIIAPPPTLVHAPQKSPWVCMPRNFPTVSDQATAFPIKPTIDGLDMLAMAVELA